MLRGRAAVCGGLDALLNDVRAAQSRTLVLRGEAGMGKTALLDYVDGNATGCQVLRAAGIESEMEIPFASLHQLCAPLIDRVERLPTPQSEALHVAFGVRTGDPPERLMTGLAVLSLLANAAEERPVVCLVDDAHWLDRSTTDTLTFVARRLLAEPVAMLFGVLEPNTDRTWSDLPTWVIDGLGEDDARTLLASAVHGPLDERVRERIIRESRGNPLALLEMYRGMTPAELAGGLGATDGGPLVRRIEHSFRRRLDELPRETQRLLVVAAAEPLGDAALLWRAVDELTLRPTAIGHAIDDGLLEVGTSVRFRHPVVRSLVYRSAPLEQRREVHAVLARVTDPIADPDRRAWHRALATAGADDEVADELERSAGRAQARGGITAAAAFYERALELTADPIRRTERALATAELLFESGALDRSADVLAVAETSRDELQAARGEHLRARLLFTRQRGRETAALLVSVAQRLQDADPDRAREVYLDAFGAAVSAGHLGAGCGPFEVAAAARSGPLFEVPGSHPVNLLFDALTIRYSDGYAAAVAPLQRALGAFHTLDDAATMRWTALELNLLTGLWLDEMLHERASRRLGTARALGALSVLTVVLPIRASVHIDAGEFSQAAALLEEAVAIARATGTVPDTGVDGLLAAWRGDEHQTMTTLERTARDAAARGDARAAAVAEYATSVLHAGLGRYDSALASARGLSEHERFGLSGPALSELVEAAARTGHREEAQRAFERLSERTQASPTDWALGVHARAHALLSDDPEDLHRESVERLGRTRMVVQHARSHLLYGEWLRRENRRADARAQLHQAFEMFDAIGADAFADRARRELLATGETVRKRTDDTRDELTPQERQIALLVRDGLTNPEIATQLFLSARTVEWHLRKVFTKLGITSRRDLRNLVRSW